MDVMERARQEPECLSAWKSLEDARKSLSAVESRQVDIQAHIHRSVSQWGIFALCGSTTGSMFLLSKSGLTGTGALVGLAVGFIGVPALAMWLVKKNGEDNAKGEMDALARQKQQLTGVVQQRQAAYDQVVPVAVDRLYKEAEKRQKQSAPDPDAKVSATPTTVQIGKIKVERKLTAN